MYHDSSLRCEIFLYSSDADVVKCLACPADEVENVENLLPVAETVQHTCGGAQIIGKRPNENQMTVDAVQLCHDDADILCTPRRLNPCQLLDRKRITKVVVHRGDVVEAVCIRKPLHICPIFEQLFNAAMEVAHNGRRLDDALAVEFELHLQDPMR